MKRGIIIPTLGILLIGSVSAFGLNYGYYFDGTTIAFAALFLIFFAIINFALGRTALRENTASRTIIALGVAILAVYGLSTTNFTVQSGYFGNWYIGDYLPTILGGIILAGAIYLLHKFGFAKVLIGTGIVLMILSQTNLIYEKNIVLIVGIILTLMGLFLLMRHNRKPREPKPPRRFKVPKEPKQKTNEKKEKRKRKTRERSERELRKKYSKYSVKIQAIMHRNNQRIPARNTPDGHLYHRYVQAMRAIENLARKKGIRL